MSNEPTDPKEKLKTLGDTIVDALKDVAQLEVLTFEGELKAIVKKEDDKNLIDWTALLEKAEAVEGQVSLVAATQIEIDGDTKLFVARDAPEALKKAHLEATAAAQEYRRGLVDAFADLLGLR